MRYNVETSPQQNRDGGIASCFFASSTMRKTTQAAASCATARQGVTGHGRVSVVVSRQLSSRLTLAFAPRFRASRSSSSFRCVVDDNNGQVKMPKQPPRPPGGAPRSGSSSSGGGGGGAETARRESSKTGGGKEDVNKSVDELLDSPFFANNKVPYNRSYTQDSPKLLPFSTVPDMWRSLARCDETATLVAVEDPHHDPPSSYTYEELESHMADFSRGLASKGVLPSQRVALFAEASSRWLIADGGILMSGAANAVRGSKAPAEELAYIAGHANVTALVVDTAEVLKDVFTLMTETARSKLRVIVVLWGSHARVATKLPCPVLSFEQVLELGAQLRPVSHKVVSNNIVGTTTGEESSSSSSFSSSSTGPGPGPGSAAATSAAAAKSKPVAKNDTWPNVAKNTWPTHPVQPGDLATVVYTSGTTGAPKGVMLTHRNLVSQVQRLGTVTKPKPGDKTLSLLPPWHAYERATAYFTFSCGVRQRYTNVASLKRDLMDVRPDAFITVPLVLGTLYARVMAGLAAAGKMRALVAKFLLAAGAMHVRAMRVINGVDIRFALAPPNVFAAFFARVVAAITAPLHRLAEKSVYPKVREGLAIKSAIVSGGGSLPSHLDDFYETIGLEVSNGWGLTETSPVIAARRLETDSDSESGGDGDAGAVAHSNVRGSVGVPIPGTEVRVIDPNTREDLPDGHKGLLLVRGPGVMSGYLDDTASTALVIDEDGWFETGDLGWVAPAGVEGSNMAGNVVLVGRVKDTIVLSSGENVEPAPLEDHVLQSPLVRQVMIVGNGERGLGALVVPDVEAVEEFLGGFITTGHESPLEVVTKAVAKEVAQRLASRSGARPEEVIPVSRVVVLPPEQVWDIDSGCLTRTFKLRRDEIAKRHAQEINEIFHRV